MDGLKKKIRKQAGEALTGRSCRNQTDTVALPKRKHKEVWQSDTRSTGNYQVGTRTGVMSDRCATRSYKEVVRHNHVPFCADAASRRRPRPPTETEPRAATDRNATCLHYAGPSHMKCGIEFDEWMMVGALIRQNDTVLELGARYGTTSCSLAAATRNTGHIVSVGPDGQALPFLLQNRLHCSVAVLHSAVGDRQLKFSRSDNPDGYGSSTSLAPERGGLTTHVPMPTWSVGKLETRFGWRFDVALIDCEGCIETALSARFAHPGRAATVGPPHALGT